ncbi:MAG: xanthine dehydrogenase [Ruminococcaceae bacterium]|nr:xanthine dehydrogenase [Oscillospiraceae bacterium]
MTMANNEFETIFSALRRGEAAALHRTVGGAEHTRRFVPRERLILLGGGHVARALAEVAAALDFAVTVVDDRPAFANRERFPRAEQIVCDAFEGAIRALDVRAGDYVCVLTRGHRWDRECLQELLRGTEPSYLGMIGSKRRVRGLLDALAEEGFDRAALQRIHAPIGLMIGAVTPEEIAVSIAAQLIEHRRAQPADAAEDALAQTNSDMGLLRFLAEGEGKKALCLVLETRGSTPVKSGAVMAVDAQGNIYGTIGGGCGEAEAITRARALLGTGASAVIEVDMTEDAAAEDGLTCGGTMKVYLEDVKA